MQNKRQLGPIVARVLLGFPLVGIPLSYFLKLQAPPHEGAAAELIDALIGSGYLMHFVKGTLLAVGIALLANRFVPLALTVLAPVMLNILAFHLFLEPHTIAFPLVLSALHAYLVYTHRDVFASLFLLAPREPVGADARARSAHSPVPTRA